jgi:hypothetical protein
MEASMLTLLCNGTVITPSEVIENGGVLFEDGIIKDVGKTDDVRAKFFKMSGDKINLKIIDAKKKNNSSGIYQRASSFIFYFCPRDVYSGNTCEKFC